MKIRLHMSPWSDQIEMAVFVQEGNGKTFLAAPLTLNQFPENSIIGQPTMSFDAIAAQDLMDQLWQCGIRPSEGSGSAGQLAAVQKHLEDMRTLVFKP